MKNSLIKSNIGILMYPGSGNKVCNAVEEMLIEQLLCAGKVESRTEPFSDLFTWLSLFLWLRVAF